MKKFFFTVLVLAISSGCAVMRPASVKPRAPASSPQAFAPDAADPWSRVREVLPGTRVAVYLENGGRMVQILTGASATELFLDVGAFPRDQIVALATAPADRLLNGVLAGAGIGAGVGVGYAAALSDSELSRTATGIGAIYGMSAGAGIGALLDSGIATRERPLYLRGNASPPSGATRHWQFDVRALTLHRWISGRNVELMLRDGTYVKGKVLRGESSLIRIAARKASDKTYAGRETEIPTDRISTVFYRERIGGNRFAATLGGALAGLFSGLLLGGSDSASPAGVVIGGGLGLVLGTGTGLGLSEHYNLREVTLNVK
jgi:hypothetical protein